MLHFAGRLCSRLLRVITDVRTCVITHAIDVCYHRPAGFTVNDVITVHNAYCIFQLEALDL